MYCRNCGESINDSAEMCPKCGCRLKMSTEKSSESLDAVNNSVNGGNSIFSNLPPYYQEEFQKIYDSGETYRGKFNIWAFLFGPIWALTKRCWKLALGAVAFSFITAGVGGVLYWIIFGFKGTYIYYCAYVKDEQLMM